jgi:FdhD protein
MARRIGANPTGRRPDEVIVEEPLEIHLDGHLVATTMRTPGHDYELAAGFCFSDGLLAGGPVTGVRYCATGSAVETEFNVVTVDSGGLAPEPVARLGTTSSSCGLCGSVSIESLTDRLEPVTAVTVDPEALAKVAALVRADQQLFDSTGGVHAAAAFDPITGQPSIVREDIGRHNAVDKVVGRLLLDGAVPATGHALWVSGRASFEMVQKAWAAGFGALVSVSAPSGLAIGAAQRAGMTLIGFARDDSATLYG